MRRTMIVALFFCVVMMVGCRKDPYFIAEDVVGGFDANGASNALFSVSSSKKVHFSMGNLQYQASTGTWRFAQHQYDCIGSANSPISSSYSGWIDLFGWGTSGWNSGVTCYQPWATSTSYSDYYPGGSYTNNLTGSYANADWGVYNRISNGGNQTGMWRALTKDEWLYLISYRTNASSKRGAATVNGMAGLVLLPDSWVLPSGLTFNPSMNSFSSNTYTVSQWSQMEDNGALFLPAAGGRNGNGVYYAGTIGYYWSSTYSDEMYARYMGFYSGGVGMGNYDRCYGFSVRLVKD